MNRNAPAQGKATRGSNGNTNACKTARPTANEDFIRATSIRQGRNPGDEAFGMATANVLMAFGDNVLTTQQGNRAIRTGCFDDQAAHAVQTIVLKRSKAGRGDRSKIVAGSPYPSVEMKLDFTVVPAKNA